MYIYIYKIGNPEYYPNLCVFMIYLRIPMTESYISMNLSSIERSYLGKFIHIASKVLTLM